MSAASTSGPLAGVRVIDWTQFGVGPFATSLLGALGADVIKIENPPLGDPQQFIPPTIDGVAALYINFNTTKRSIFLDLRSEPDREVFDELMEGADVFVNSQRPSSVKKLGLDPEAVLERYPHLVYCTSNGWGEAGPRVEHPGADYPLQAFCGWCSVMGSERGPWEVLRFLGQIDLNTSLYIVGAILTGLAARNRMGGQVIRVSMLESAIAMQASRVAEYLSSGVAPGPLGSASSVVAPSQAFQCGDGGYLAVSAETESQWRRLCDAIERVDLVDREEFRTNADRVEHRQMLAAELGAELIRKPLPRWTQQLSALKVPNARYLDFDLIRYHPQVRENEHVIELDTGRFGTVYTGGAPWKFEQASTRITRPPNRAGQDTDEVLSKLSHRRTEEREEPAAAIRSDELPFTGLRVVELATGIAGPYAGSLLADQGADVIKIEPSDGDRSRFWGPPFVDGVGAPFVELNRNKRLLRSARETGLEGFTDLIEKTDVVIVDAVDPDGNPPALDLRELRRRCRQLVVCSISAYGERGPFADQPGSELTVQALSNTWAGLGRVGEPPRRLGADQASMNAGLTAYHGIVAALFRREQTGQGDRVETSLLGTHLCIKGMHWVCLSNPDQWPGVHLSVWTDPPNHGVRTKDRPILVALRSRAGRPLDPVNVRSLIELLGGEYPSDLDFDAPLGNPSNPRHHRWHDFWSDLFQDISSEEAIRLVEEHGGEATPFLDYASFDTDEHMQHVKPFATLEGAAGRRVVRLPWRLGGLTERVSYKLPMSMTEAELARVRAFWWA